MVTKILLLAILPALTACGGTFPPQPLDEPCPPSWQRVLTISVPDSWRPAFDRAKDYWRGQFGRDAVQAATGNVDVIATEIDRSTAPPVEGILAWSSYVAGAECGPNERGVIVLVSDVEPAVRAVTLAHEIGHLLGLQHQRGTLMSNPTACELPDCTLDDAQWLRARDGLGD